MRKTQLLLIAAGSLIILSGLNSCTKVLDPVTEKSDLSLKSAKLNVELTTMEQLGKSIYFDKISNPNSMACADCHAPSAGFTGPMAGINIHGSVYRGADGRNFGARKPPSAAYATASPVFDYDEVEGLFVGGNFWDGRATGESLGSPSAEQAIGPFLNPAEHNLADAKSVLMKIAKAKYASLWEKAWGEPLAYGTVDEVKLNYDRVGLAVAAFEASKEVNQFSSKYDAFLAGGVKLTAQEAWGLELFEGKGMCSACHPNEGKSALFTDFTFDNLGTPKNPANPVYKSNPSFIDPGLGGFLATREDYKGMAAENWGKHKVPTLRNVGKKPGSGFTKAYMHNGVFKSLKEVVHFYNTRDVKGAGWPSPEVAQNVNTDELGNLGLSGEEENALVAFMETLSDGFTMKK